MHIILVLVQIGTFRRTNLVRLAFRRTNTVGLKPRRTKLVRLTYYIGTF